MLIINYGCTLINCKVLTLSSCKVSLWPRLGICSLAQSMACLVRDWPTDQRQMWIFRKPVILFAILVTLKLQILDLLDLKRLSSLFVTDWLLHCQCGAEKHTVFHKYCLNVPFSKYGDIWVIFSNSPNFIQYLN